jgi:hypothetical protein
VIADSAADLRNATLMVLPTRFPGSYRHVDNLSRTHAARWFVAACSLYHLRFLLICCPGADQSDYVNSPTSYRATDLRAAATSAPTPDISFQPADFVAVVALAALADLRDADISSSPFQNAE